MNQRHPDQVSHTIVTRIIIRSYPFTINNHLGILVEVQVPYLGYVGDILHVGSITASTENASNFGGGINVMRGNECSSSVIYKRLEFNGKFLG